MNTPPLTPDDRERLTQIDALLEHGQPSADPAANWLHRQRPPINHAHYDQLKKEILTMTIDDLTPKKKKRPVRALPRLLKAAAAVAIFAGGLVAGLAIMRPSTGSMVGYIVYDDRPMNPITIYPDAFMLEATALVANVTSAAQAIDVFPTPPPPPFAVIDQLSEPAIGILPSLEARDLPSAMTVIPPRYFSFYLNSPNLQRSAEEYSGVEWSIYIRVPTENTTEPPIIRNENGMIEDSRIHVLLTHGVFITGVWNNEGFTVQLPANVTNFVNALTQLDKVYERTANDSMLFFTPRGAR
jgi:hypothetical protein